MEAIALIKARLPIPKESKCKIITNQAKKIFKFKKEIDVKDIKAMILQGRSLRYISSHYKAPLRIISVILHEHGTSKEKIITAFLYKEFKRISYRKALWKYGKLYGKPVVKGLYKQYAKEKDKHFKNYDKQALSALNTYDWVENNVRELENEIEHAVIFAEDGPTIRYADLSEKLRGEEIATEFTSSVRNSTGKPTTLADFEKKYIANILAQAKGNKSEAARLMGIPRSTLMGKLRKHSTTKK